MKKFIQIRHLLFKINKKGNAIMHMMLTGGGTNIKNPNSSLHLHLFQYPIRIARCLESASFDTL